MKKLLILFVLLAGFCSCHTISDLQIEKRHYRKGYYVHVRPHRYTEPLAYVQPERIPTERTQTTAAMKSEPAPVQKTEAPIAENPAPVAANPPQETQTSNPADVQDNSVQRSMKPVAQQRVLPQSAAPVSKTYFQNYNAGKSIPPKLEQ